MIKYNFLKYLIAWNFHNEIMRRTQPSTDLVQSTNTKVQQSNIV